jgi:hypothetical protein
MEVNPQIKEELREGSNKNPFLPVAERSRSTAKKIEERACPFRVPLRKGHAKKFK